MKLDPHMAADAIAQASLIVCDDAAHEHAPVVGPIYQTSLFTFDNYADMADTFAGRRRQPIYSRGDNPVSRLNRRRNELRSP